MGSMEAFVLTLVLLFAVPATSQTECDETETELPSWCRSRSFCKGPQATFTIPDPILNNFINRNCFCDDLCRAYGDCCSDVGDVSDGTGDGITELEGDTFTCAVRSNLKLEYAFPVYLVEKCPKHWTGNTEIKLLCEAENENDNVQTNVEDDVFLDWPVENAAGVLYRNTFCALCHGQKDQLTYWRSNITCLVGREDEYQNTTLILQDLLYDNSRECSIHFEPPLSSGREQRYCKQAVSTCDSSWTDACDIRENCEKTPVILYEYSTKETNGVRDVIYSNNYCAQCNFDSNATCFDDISKKVLIEVIKEPHAFYPLSIVIDLNSRSTTIADQVGQDARMVNVTTEAINTCPEFHVFDPFLDKCRQLVCSDGYEWTPEGTCELNSTQDCQRLPLNKTEFDIFPNGTLVEINSGVSHEKGSYELIGDVVLVCTSLTQNHTEYITTQEIAMMFKYSEAQKYLSMVCQIISIIALTIQLVVYTLLPALRNLPGKNLMCLTASLLVAQFLFLFGTGSVENYGACVVFSAVLHFAFLASFFWMNIMSYDVWTTFSPSNHSAVLGNPNRRFARYSAYAWGCPILIVTLTLTINFINGVEEKFRPGYGEGLCWITHRLALLVFFAAPLSLLLCVNFALYTSTVVNIWRVQKATKLVHNDKPDKYRFLLYVKLSTIMGLTWIFGFVATLAENHSHVMWYFFIIFNALQGAFICITFVCTKRVYRMLREAAVRMCNVPSRKRRDTEITGSSYLTKSRLSSVSNSLTTSPVHKIHSKTSRVY